MPYVRRNDQSQIHSVHRDSGAAVEFVVESDSKVIRSCSRSSAPRRRPTSINSTPV